LPLDSTDTTEAPRYRKPTLDVYTVLLAVALAALILGTLILYFDTAVFDFKLRGAPSAATFDPAAATRWALARVLPGCWT